MSGGKDHSLDEAHKVAASCAFVWTSENWNAIFKDCVAQERPEIVFDRDVGGPADEVAEVPLEPRQIDERKRLRWINLDQQVDIAPGPSVAARDGAEERQRGHASGTELGLVGHERMDDTLTLRSRASAARTLGDGTSHGQPDLWRMFAEAR